jgi:membrane protease YdiL (CAAX protease family)
MPEQLQDNGSGHPVSEALAVAAGLAGFALCSHQGLPWIIAGATGFLLAASTLGWSLVRVPRPAALLGFASCSRRIAFFTAGGCVLGLGLGGLHRWRLGLPLAPVGGLEAFAALACLIGATEELVYRGWLQGRLRELGWPVAVLGAAVAHAGYKTLLFAWPGETAPVNLLVIGFWTVTGGVFFGWLREFSGSLLPPLFAHAVFDLMTYGAVARAPWWVWT